MADNEKKVQKKASTKRASSRYGSSPSGAGWKEYLFGGGIVAIVFVAALLIFNKKDSEKKEGEQPAPAPNATNTEQREDLLEKAAILEKVESQLKSYKDELEGATAAAIKEETAGLQQRIAELEAQLQALKQQKAEAPVEEQEPPMPPPVDEVVDQDVPPVDEAVEEEVPFIEEGTDDVGGIDDIIDEAANDLPEDEEAAEEVEEPEEGTAAPEETAETSADTAVTPVKIVITKDSITLNGKPVELEDITANLQKRNAALEDKDVSLAAAADVNYQRMRNVMNAVTKANWRFSFKVAESSSAEEPGESAATDEDEVTAQTAEASVTDQIIADAMALAKENKFAQAMAKLNSRPDLRDTMWQAEREKTRQTIRKQANVLYQSDMTRAEKLEDQGKTAEAKAVYRTIAAYGLPDMVKEASNRIAKLTNEPEAPPVEGVTEETPAEPEEEIEPVEVSVSIADPNIDPRINRYIETLKNEQAGQSERKKAIRELGMLKAEEAVEPLIDTLKDSDWFLRVNAANALKQIGDLRAVPALIDNLSHPIIPVHEIAKDALVELTGKDFGRDQEAWRTWWKETGSKDLSEGAETEAAPTEGDDTPDKADEQTEQPKPFESQIVIFKPENQSITFNISEDSGLKAGQQVQLLRDNKPLATVEITLVGFGTASADIKNAAIDAEFNAGDMIEVKP